jgi:hypothetical protein
MQELKFFLLSTTLLIAASLVISELDDKDTYKLFKVAVLVALVMVGSVTLCLFLTPGCASWRAWFWGM